MRFAHARPKTGIHFSPGSSPKLDRSKTTCAHLVTSRFKNFSVDCARRHKVRNIYKSGLAAKLPNITVVERPTCTDHMARRIYVGNLPADPPIDDKQLREFFDQAMRQAGLLDPSNSDGCCVSDVWISAEKQFAFVEVRTVTDANNAMQLDGITLYGQALRVNRPSDYVPPPTAGPGAPGMAAPGMPGGPMGGMVPMGMGMIPGMMPPVNLKADLMQRTKKCRRVHIGNLPINVGLTPDALKQFINTVMQQMFLTVKPGEPVIDSFVSSDGKFGFVEMRTIQEATNALSMTGADCFGRY